MGQLGDPATARASHLPMADGRPQARTPGLCPLGIPSKPFGAPRAGLERDGRTLYFIHLAGRGEPLDDSTLRRAKRCARQSYLPTRHHTAPAVSPAGAGSPTRDGAATYEADRGGSAPRPPTARRSLTQALRSSFDRLGSDSSLYVTAARFSIRHCSARTSDRAGARLTRRHCLQLQSAADVVLSAAPSAPDDLYRIDGATRTQLTRASDKLAVLDPDGARFFARRRPVWGQIVKPAGATGGCPPCSDPAGRKAVSSRLVLSRIPGVASRAMAVSSISTAPRATANLH